MTLGWSRAQYLDFTDSQALALFLACHEQAFHDFGGVPEEILYDRVKTVWLRDDEHGDPVFHPGFVDFAEYYGFRPRLCRGRHVDALEPERGRAAGLRWSAGPLWASGRLAPSARLPGRTSCRAQRPQTKGKTENGVGYVRKNFWPRVRDYRDAHDLLDLRRRWLDETCNVRIHGTTGERPIDRLPKEGLRSIQDLPPYRALFLERRRVARDCFVSYAGSWYSAPAEYAGREVWVRQTEDRLVICDQDRVLAEHPLAERPYERKVIRAHFEALSLRRDQRLQWEAEQAFAQVAKRMPMLAGPEVEKRPLSVYEGLT